MTDLYVGQWVRIKWVHDLENLKLVGLAAMVLEVEHDVLLEDYEELYTVYRLTCDDDVPPGWLRIQLEVEEYDGDLESEEDLEEELVYV